MRNVIFQVQAGDEGDHHEETIIKTLKVLSTIII